MSRTEHSPPEEHPAAGYRWLVACLCADWCGACREFRAAFEALSARHPDVWFRWIDIEDEAALVEDIDVDNFPTIVIQHDAEVLFLGTSLPKASIVERQLSVFRAGPAPAPVEAPDLLARLTA